MNRDQSGPWQVLASLRFGLAGIVVCYHMTWFAPHARAATFLARFGALAAVLGFLFVSGYSIAHSLARRPKGFYRRRVIRIYPLYAAAILFSLFPFALAGRQIHVPGSDFTLPHWGQIAANLALLETIVTGPIASDPVIWTLVVEVACYLLAPLLARLKTQMLLVLTAPSIAAFAFYPRLHLDYYGVLTRGLPLLFLAWPWLMGFIFYRHRQSAAAGAALVATSVALVLLNQSYGARFAEVTVAFATLLLVVASRFSLPGALKRPLDYLGDLSYPLYLFHVPAILFGWSILHLHNPWLLIACALATSALALAVESIARRFLFSHPAHAPAGQAKIIEPTAA